MEGKSLRLMDTGAGITMIATITTKIPTNAPNTAFSINTYYQTKGPLGYGKQAM